MPEATPKTIQTCFRLTPSTREKLFARADAAGMNGREWLEQAILENATKIVAKQKPHPELRPLLFQVNKAGNNINQLAHHFNTLQLANKLTTEQALAALSTLDRIEKELLEAVEYAR